MDQTHADRARPSVKSQRPERPRHLADDGRHLTDLAGRFAGIFVGIVTAAPFIEVTEIDTDGDRIARQVCKPQLPAAKSGWTFRRRRWRRRWL